MARHCGQRSMLDRDTSSRGGGGVLKALIAALCHQSGLEVNHVMSAGVFIPSFSRRSRGSVLSLIHPCLEGFAVNDEVDECDPSFSPTKKEADGSIRDQKRETESANDHDGPNKDDVDACK